MDALQLIQKDTMECLWEAPRYIIFSIEVDPLVYYSHLFPAMAILILSSLLFFRKRNSFVSKYFVSISILFTLYAFFDLIVWASINPSAIMFFWSLLIYIEPLLYLATLFLVLTYIKQKEVSEYHFIAAGLIMLPIIILGPTHLNLAGFDYSDCWRLVVEGPLAATYVYLAEFLIVAWLVIESIVHIFRKGEPTRKKQSLFMLTGSVLFLLALSSGNVFGTLLQGVMGEGSWVISQYGFFGMPLFLGFVLYLIVQFEAFQTKLIGANALTGSLWVLLAALLFINDIATARTVIIVTLILFTGLGYLLIKSVRQEVKHREEIEQLAHKLKKANKRLKVLDQMKSEFVSIASHQLRSPLTSIRGYASMLSEGSYGKLPIKAAEAIERISDSSSYMASSIEDYLNVSRIESGNMKYELSDFNLKDEAEHVADDKRQEAMKKGLLITFRSDLDKHGIVNADIGKTRQILHNLVNNAIKYTPRGTITIYAHNDSKKKMMYVDIIDSGIGMKAEELDNIFGKFERAHNANQTNVTGTGLGLFVARMMARQMKGEVTAFSDGVGHGSTFRLEMPLQM